MPVLSTISDEIDEYGFKTSETFVTERGLKLSIRPNPNGLYEIVPHGAGANTPLVSRGLFTSHMKAREALIAYINETDHLGYAVHPDKPAEKIRKSKRQLIEEELKKDEDGTS